jgi:uncharacterized protein (TIGR02246 family)
MRTILKMTRDELQTWLDRYVAAWRVNEPATIAELFSEDAVYRFHPYDHDDDVARGRDQIVAAWLETPDDPATWEASYQAFAVDGDRAVATGISHYLPTGDQEERVYDNCFLMRFGPDGRCTEFTEYFVRRPK